MKAKICISIEYPFQKLERLFALLGEKEFPKFLLPPAINRLSDAAKVRIMHRHILPIFIFCFRRFLPPLLNFSLINLQSREEKLWV